MANPARAADIHAEMNPDKKQTFAEEYRNLTGVVLSLPGDKAPFYVWKPGSSKYGVQLRVYFFGTMGAHPDAAGLFNITDGRAKGTLRINNGEFVRGLFAAGFLIGKNADCAVRVRERAGQFTGDFDEGFGMMTAQERAELLVREECAQTGSRTFEADTLVELINKHGARADETLKQLCARGVLLENKNHNAYTLSGADILPGELEKESAVLVVRGESNADKREVLLETYARNRGWVRLAKKVFGEKCMCQNCNNAFTKKDGKPYIEVHHIVPLHKGGEDGVWNLSVLCAHHHRMAHFARDKDRRTISSYLVKENQRLRAAVIKP